jgi:hypothetical protein
MIVLLVNLLLMPWSIVSAAMMAPQVAPPAPQAAPAPSGLASSGSDGLEEAVKKKKKDPNAPKKVSV